MTWLLACALLQGVPGSDLSLEGAPLDQFLKTKGRAFVGRDVHWHVPARAFSKPVRCVQGVVVFVHLGVGLAVSERSTALDELKRRGGTACIRGRVIAVRGPPSKDVPPCAIVVRDLSRRKGGHAKK